MIRIFLTGQVAIETPDSRVDERVFGGHQVRLVLAYLVIERQRPVHREELAEALWPSTMPPTWGPAVRALVSKARGLFLLAGVTAREAVTHSLGCYQVHLPENAVVDTEVAASAVEAAEQALRTEPDRAWGPALAAASVARRTFLPGEEGAWVNVQRNRLHALLLRALQALSDSRFRRGEYELALVAAEEAVSLAPFRDSAHRQLMRAHAAAGDRAEALRDYERYRVLMAHELGVDPSSAIRALHLELLHESRPVEVRHPARDVAYPRA